MTGPGAKSPDELAACDVPVDVEQLVWMLLDDQITAEQFQELERLLHDDVQARQKYVQCVQMHSDLCRQFAVDQTQSQPSSRKSPVVGFLSSDPTTSQTDLPMTGDSCDSPS